jgi:hypothetical protein
LRAARSRAKAALFPTAPSEEKKRDTIIRTVSDLDFAAQQWDPSDYATLERWEICLHQPGFYDIYMNSTSQATVTLKSLSMFESRAPGAAATERVLLKLFNQTLAGTPDDHRWMLESLKRVYTSIQGSEEKILFCDQVEKSFAAHMKARAALKRGSQLLSQDFNRGGETRPLPAELAHFIDSNSPANLTSLVSKKVEMDANVQHFFHLLRSCGDVWGQKSPLHALQLTFYEIEKDLRMLMDTKRINMAEHERQIKAASDRKANIQIERDAKLAEVQSSENELIHSRVGLLAKKMELEKELRMVDSQLAGLHTQIEASHKKKDEIKETYNFRLENVSSLVQQFEGQWSSCQTDSACAKALLDYMLGSYSRGSDHAKQIQSQVQAISKTLFSNYIQSLASCLRTNQDLVTTLEQRVAFIERKLAQITQERIEMRSLGLDVSSLNQAEASLLTELKNDQSIIASTRRNVFLLLSQAQHGTPPDQTEYALELFQNLYASLQEFSVTFDLSELQKLIKHLISYISLSKTADSKVKPAPNSTAGSQNPTPKVSAPAAAQTQPVVPETKSSAALVSRPTATTTVQPTADVPEIKQAKRPIGKQAQTSIEKPPQTAPANPPVVSTDVSSQTPKTINFTAGAASHSTSIAVEVSPSVTSAASQPVIAVKAVKAVNSIPNTESKPAWAGWGNTKVQAVSLQKSAGTATISKSSLPSETKSPSPVSELRLYLLCFFLLVWINYILLQAQPSENNVNSNYTTAPKSSENSVVPSGNNANPKSAKPKASNPNDGGTGENKSGAPRPKTAKPKTAKPNYKEVTQKAIASEKSASPTPEEISAPEPKSQRARGRQGSRWTEQIESKTAQ